ncbi:MAG: T9SS type A sorting domain-containing protein, partial [Bacteroidota bacterium]|nr:T9SS type A sorting domain-containing protein [Bacteroidota bacterium]MDX5429704.1 T9SS type A sorting domain-containing protein [Bacteroidota bacterium]MDX5468485.1 T9SS type A sorting domain-containing protein [Bacteroidota bacterium]
QTSAPSSPMSFSVGGSGLTNDIVINVNAPFEVRTSGGNYSTSVTLSPTSGNVIPTTIEVRMSPSNAGNFSDTIQITSTGAFTNQIVVSGEGISNPVVSFLNASGSYMEGGMDSIGIYVLNKGNNTITVDLMGQPGNTAIEGQNFVFSNGPQVVFDATTRDTLYVAVEFPDDVISGPRIRRNKIGMNLGGGIIGANDSFSLSISENDYKYAKIAEIKQLDADFLPISFDSLFEITGVVYGTNTRTSGYSFTIIDETAGISNFAPSSAPTFGYTITEGDSILMRGRLTHFNGLIQLDFLDTIKLLKAGTPLKQPMLVNSLDESTENEFVRINNVAFVTPTPTWSVAGSGTNYRVYNTVTFDTFDIRVLPTSTLANTVAPTVPFDVIGIGGQFDGSNPRNSGYQLFPRYDTDVIVDQLGAFDLITPANNATVTLEGDPAQEVNVSWGSSEALNGGAVPNYFMLLDLPTGDFSSPLLSLPANTDTTLALTYKQLADAFGASLSPGGSLTLIWTVKADNGSQEEMAQSVYTINFGRGIIDGLVDIQVIARVYPNPSSDYITVETNETPETLSLFDMNGKEIVRVNPESSSAQLDVRGIESGVYLLVMTLDGKQYQNRVVIQHR